MKIKVVHKSGKVEVITLTEPILIQRGKPFCVLTVATGMQHFFSEDGSYDGWGMAVSLNLKDDPSKDPEGLEMPPEVKSFIDAIEAEREFPDQDTAEEDNV